MTRHPGTEGNELHPSDVIIPDPSGGDGRLSVRNDLAAEFAGLAISSTQPTDMPNGGVWVNLSADPTGIDRLQTYDDSTNAFIPISADSTVVSEQEPEPEIGLLWFEPVDDGANLYAANADSWQFLQLIREIADGTVDNFNDADADPPGAYESGDDLSTYYSEDLGEFSRTTSNVIEGGHGVGIGDQGQIVSEEGGGLPNYPDEGQTVRFLLRDTNTAIPGVILGGAKNTNGVDGYGFTIRPQFPDITIYRYDDGSEQALDSTEASGVSQDTWYWGEANAPTADDDTVNFSLYEVDTSGSSPDRGSIIASLSINDTSHADNTGVGLTSVSSDGSSGAAIDEIKIV